MHVAHPLISPKSPSPAISSHWGPLIFRSHLQGSSKAFTTGKVFPAIPSNSPCIPLKLNTTFSICCSLFDHSFSIARLSLSRSSLMATNDSRIASTLFLNSDPVGQLLICSLWTIEVNGSRKFISCSSKIIFYYNFL